MIPLLVFLIALPMSVYLLAGALSLLDGGNRSVALMRLALRLTLFVGLVVLIPTDTRVWAAAAFLTVLVLHVAAPLALRRAITSGRWITERVD
ncbi:MAG: hypothetical protein PVH91_00425 [Pseudomonadales bacterium]|jgi:hypothetical protein